MTLSTHAVVGAGIAIVTKANPVIAFVLGFASHFILDSIPHWDYPIRSDLSQVRFSRDVLFARAFLRDIAFITFDALFGLCIVYFLLLHHSVFGSSIFVSALWGAAGAMVPDLLQFVYMKWKREPLISLQRFHADIMHAELRLDDWMVVGPLIQIVLIAAVIFFVW